MGMHRSEGATALLGMDGFVVGAQLEVDGEVWLSVETTADVAGCEACGTRAVGHGRRVVRVRDMPVGDRHTVLVWRKRIWRCPEPDCEVCTFSEDTDAVAPRAVATERARAEMCRRVGQDGHSVAQVARAFGVSWHAAMAAVVDHGRPRVDHLSRLRLPNAIGLDETSFLAATATHPTLLVSGFVDLDRHRLIDVVAGRSAAAVSSWLAAKPSAWLAGIATVVIDPYAGYAQGLAEGLPHARLVVDHFHAVRLANQALDEVRRRVQQQTLGHRGRRHDPLYRARRRLLTSHERLGAEAWARVSSLLDAGDPAGEVGAAYLAKELLREVYATTSLRLARRRLERFYRHCRHAEVHELARLARTIRRWEGPILAWHTTWLTNGPTEAVNLLVKKIKRVGHGFRNFDNYRLRLLLHCGVRWQTRPAASMRRRQPRFVA
ncbi:MAG: ISL3 family transposase [Actinomycetota bacterium]|nr:ISL3 family transposase [Actinomycetota bacterium]